MEIVVSREQKIIKNNDSGLISIPKAWRDLIGINGDICTVGLIKENGKFMLGIWEPKKE